MFCSAEEGTRPEGGQGVKTFDEMQLSPNLLRGIYGYGFAKPSIVQLRVIPPLVGGRDLVVQAFSGGGKTSALAIGLLQRMDWSLQECQGLVLCPTRELSIATSHHISSLGEGLSGRVNPFSHFIVGGVRVSETLGKFEDRPVVIVGTPARVYDATCRGWLRTTHIKLVAVDEADELMSRGFSENLLKLLESLPTEAQVALFSATLPPDVLELTQFTKDPVWVKLAHRESVLEASQHFFFVTVDELHKLEALLDILAETSPTQSAVIFCNTQRKADWLWEKMEEAGFTASHLTADMAREERTQALHAFDSGSARVLVSTDPTPQCIPFVQLIVNFDIPANLEVYKDRLGLSRRIVQRVVVNLATDSDTVNRLQNHYNCTIEELPEDFASLLK